MMILAHLMNCVWLVEQPASSLLNLHERFQSMLYRYLPYAIPASWQAYIVLLQCACMCPCVCVSLQLLLASKTYRQSLWMCKFGHRVPKRTTLWANSPLLRVMERGRLCKKQKQGGGKAKPKIVKKYRNRKGKQCVVGTSILKRTELLVCKLAIHIPCVLFSSC